MSWPGAMLLAAFVLAEPAEPGDPPDAPVEWVDPARSCPELDGLQRHAEQLLGRAIEPGEVTVRVTVLDGTPRRAQIALGFQGREELRDIEGPDCASLVDAAALLIAVTLDPPSVPEPEPEPLAPPLPPLPSEPPPLFEPPLPSEPLPLFEQSPPEAIPARRPSPPIHLAVGLAVGGELGAIPRGTGGFRPSLHLTRGRFEAQVAGDYWIRRERQVLATGEGVRVGLGVAALRACGLLRRDRLTIPLCGGIEAGAMRGVGIELRSTRSDIQPWIAGLATASARLRISRRIELSALAEAFVPVRRPQFEAGTPSGSLVLHVPWPAGGRLLLGIVVRAISW